MSIFSEAQRGLNLVKKILDDTQTMSKQFGYIGYKAHGAMSQFVTAHEKELNASPRSTTAGHQLSIDIASCAEEYARDQKNARHVIVRLLFSLESSVGGCFRKLPADYRTSDRYLAALNEITPEHADQSSLPLMIGGKL